MGSVGVGSRKDALVGTESIRKCRRELASKMEIDEEEDAEEGDGKGLPAAATSGRPVRFPEPEDPSV